MASYYVDVMYFLKFVDEVGGKVSPSTTFFIIYLKLTFCSRFKQNLWKTGRGEGIFIKIRMEAAARKKTCMFYDILSEVGRMNGAAPRKINVTPDAPNEHRTRFPAVIYFSMEVNIYSWRIPRGYIRKLGIDKTRKVFLCFRKIFIVFV